MGDHVADPRHRSVGGEPADARRRNSRQQSRSSCRVRPPARPANGAPAARCNAGEFSPRAICEHLHLSEYASAQFDDAKSLGSGAPTRGPRPQDPISQRALRGISSRLGRARKGAAIFWAGASLGLQFTENWRSGGGVFRRCDHQRGCRLCSTLGAAPGKCTGCDHHDDLRVAGSEP